MSYYPIFYIYIYICINFVFFCIFQHCRNTYTRWSHWCHIHIIFSSWFYLIIVTSKNSLPNCEHDPSYQQRSQSNLVKAFFVLHGEVLTGFKHSFKKQLSKVFYKKAILKNFAILIGKHLCWSPFSIILQAYKPTILLQRDSNTGVFLWILQNF